MSLDLQELVIDDLQSQAHLDLIQSDLDQIDWTCQIGIGLSDCTPQIGFVINQTPPTYNLVPPTYNPVPPTYNDNDSDFDIWGPPIRNPPINYETRPPRKCTGRNGTCTNDATCVVGTINTGPSGGAISCLMCRSCFNYQRRMRRPIEQYRVRRNRY